MTLLSATFIPTPLARPEGFALLSAAEAIIKGALEAETNVSLLAGPRGGSFADVLQLADSAAASSILRDHGLRVMPVPRASRAVTLAQQVVRSGGGAIALVPNAVLDDTMNELSRVTRDTTPAGALCLMLEDAPTENPASCPRRAARRLDIPCLEAADVSQLRDSIDHTLLMSRAARCPVALVVHASVLRSSDTVELRPNRVGRVVEVLSDRRQRRGRIGVLGEGVSALRIARRLELNHFRATPSPGERLAVGFITVGPADRALMHLVQVFSLQGRVPILHLLLVHPIDDAAVGRMLARSQNVVVLEPRPGTIEVDVLMVAETMRQRGEQPAAVWGQRIPQDDNANPPRLSSDHDLHPSILARKITHLLEAIRPTLDVAGRLAPDPPLVPAPPPRDKEIGSGAALAEVRRLLRDVDQWLRERAPLEERAIAPTALAIDGAQATGRATRIVHAETWDHERFERDGIHVVVQAAQDDRPWLLVICETLGEDIRDLERLARGAIPGDRTDRVTLVTANLNDLAALRDVLREAVLRDGFTVLIVRDGPPPQYDVAAIDDALSEIDRLGFEPRQRLIIPADGICALRPEQSDESQAHVPLSSRLRRLKTEIAIDEVPERVTTRFRLRVRPLSEEVEVTRVRPPAIRSPDQAMTKLASPQIIHGRLPQWRAHLAGYRSDPPGAVATVLLNAGRFMGYHVRCLHDPEPIGPGRRAWAQILLTHPRPDEPAPQITARIPFGEANLLLGLDPHETLRAIGADPNLCVADSSCTSAVVNLGPFIDDRDFNSRNVSNARPHGLLAAVTQPTASLFLDLAAVCRRWFHTDRVTDMVTLGAAYQLGLVPVSAEAIEAGLAVAEGGGLGRSREAFELGRRLAVEPHVFAEREEEIDEPVARLARRMALSFRRGLPGAAARARQLAALMQQSLEQMPGLSETDPGRQACRDFVVACHHCMVWGGLEYAHTYGDLITRLYQVDRGDTGRALTRAAVLPLAEAMLIRDPLYVAGVAASGEHRRGIRQRLHVKLARGDQVERRYLTRIDLLAFGRRARIDLRTSDWPARLALLVRRFTPQRFRGTARERALRDYVMNFIRRAIVESPDDYPRWADAMQRLHNQAAESRLRGMAMAEVRMLLEAGLPSAEEPATGGFVE